jgi:site-specific DNA-methyltransferase (adenine-specific)
MADDYISHFDRAVTSAGGSDVSGHVEPGPFKNILRDDDDKADLFFWSPPYNVSSKGPRNDKMRGRERKYSAKAFRGITDYADDLSEGEYQKQQAAALIWVADHLALGGTAVYNHKPRQKCKLIIDPHEWLLLPEVRCKLVEATHPVVWDRGSTHNCGRGQLWQQTERLYVLRRADDPTWRMDNFRGRGLEARFQSDIWRIPLSPRPVNGHNAPFPESLAEAVIKMWSRRRDWICDPYAGSGTTGVAAVRLGRNFIGAEIDSKHCALANQRIAAELPNRMMGRAA